VFRVCSSGSLAKTDYPKRGTKRFFIIGRWTATGDFRQGIDVSYVAGAAGALAAAEATPVWQDFHGILKQWGERLSHFLRLHRPDLVPILNTSQ